MITKIGAVAGEILNLLERKNRPLCFKEIVSETRGEEFLVYMALGWLIRDRYVFYENVQGDHVIYDKSYMSKKLRQNRMTKIRQKQRIYTDGAYF